MRINELPEDKIVVGLRIKSLISEKLGTVCKIDYHDDRYVWVHWDGDEKAYGGFYGNDCKCEILMNHDLLTWILGSCGFVEVKENFGSEQIQIQKEDFLYKQTYSILYKNELLKSFTKKTNEPSPDELSEMEEAIAYYITIRDILQHILQSSHSLKESLKL